MRHRASFLCAIVSLLVVGGSASAGLLDITLLPFPDVASRFIDVTYDASSQTLEADGFALLFDDDGSVPAEDIANGSFNITATITNAGVATGGALSIGGDIPGLGIVGPTLLTGDLSAFGFKPGGGPLFEFLFTVTGGELADSHYGGVGSTVGVVLSGVNFPGSFMSDWDNLINGEPGTGSAVSDTGLIPAPGSLALLVLAGLGGRRRRRS